jgi:uncharacterized protein YdiU (UPF0061 family)
MQRGGIEQRHPAQGVKMSAEPGFAERIDSTADPILSWSLESNYARLPAEFYTRMSAERVGEDPVLVHANPKAAELLGIDPRAFHRPEFAQIFSGHRPIVGFVPLAMVYAGHQFGTYVPQLGDGRALLIAQVRNRAGELWDVQIKGAGRTPYSRFGDGRAVLRSCIREYLCSEAMAALGIATTRALCIVATREGVQREAIEPGAVLTRLSPSHVRFGHFEYFHHSGRPDAVRLLADHVIAEHFPDLAGREDRYEAWFAAIVTRTAHLIAHWQAAGFAHGVMNTDNMSILGLTIDYGPFGFLDVYDPGLICNHSDDSGRYAFNRQPAIAHWNLRALAVALVSVIPVEALRRGLDGFEQAYLDRFVALMRAKLGFAVVNSDDEDLIAELLQIMAAGKADYTLTFRRLSRIDDANERAAWLDLFDPSAWAEMWLDRYRARIAAEPCADRGGAMDRVNPKYVLRNWVAETAIRAVEDNGDVAPLDTILRLLQSPFDEHAGDDRFAAPPPRELQDLSVSCSS